MSVMTSGLTSLGSGDCMEGSWISSLADTVHARATKDNTSAETSGSLSLGAFYRKIIDM